MTEGAVHQGFVLRVSEFCLYWTWADSCKDFVKKKNLTTIDSRWTNLTPHNLGSILRTADATNVTGVIIPKRRAGLNTLSLRTCAYRSCDQPQPNLDKSKRRRLLDI